MRVVRSFRLGAVSSVAALSLWSACGAEREGLGGPYDGSIMVDDPATADDGGRGVDGGSIANGGGGGNGGNASPGGSGVCGSYPIPALTQTPEVLLVVDRSGSMRTLVVDRWGPSVSAVNTITGSLEPQVQFGLMTFPGDCNTLPTADQQLACLARIGGDQSLSCEPGRIDVPAGGASAPAISQALSKTTPNGATPTASSIAAAAKALASEPADPKRGSQSIVLVTDGAPNCALGVSGLLAVGLGSANGQPEAVPQTVASIHDADVHGIRTYVIGYQTDADPSLTGSLDLMAQAGGTGATTHLRVEDQASLLSALSTLSKKALLCEVHLGQPVTDTSLLRVTVNGQVVAADPVDGYALSTDGQTVALRGKSCDAVQANPGVTAAQAEILCPPPPADAGTPGTGGPGGDADAGTPDSPVTPVI